MRAHRIIAFGLLALGAAGCPEPPALPEPAPEARSEVGQAPMQPLGEALPEEPEEPEERPTIRISAAEVTRQRWLDEPFRCRAISTTRYRRCRMQAREDGSVRIRFPLNSVTCDDVVFDAEGNPSALNACRSSWLRLPTDNQLTRIHGPRAAWSGSTRGWRWVSDGQSYCCPGLWIMEPREAVADPDLTDP